MQMDSGILLIFSLNFAVISIHLFVIALMSQELGHHIMQNFYIMQIFLNSVSISRKSMIWLLFSIFRRSPFWLLYFLPTPSWFRFRNFFYIMELFLSIFWALFTSFPQFSKDATSFLCLRPHFSFVIPTQKKKKNVPAKIFLLNNFSKMTLLWWNSNLALFSSPISNLASTGRLPTCRSSMSLFHYHLCRSFIEKF